MIEKKLKFCFATLLPKARSQAVMFSVMPLEPSQSMSRKKNFLSMSILLPPSKSKSLRICQIWVERWNAWGPGKENRPSLGSRLFPNEDKSRSKCPSPSPELQDRKGCQLTFGQADLQILNPSDRFPPASLHNISNGTKSLIAWVTQFWHHVTYLLENSFFFNFQTGQLSSSAIVFPLILGWLHTLSAGPGKIQRETLPFFWKSKFGVFIQPRTSSAGLQLFQWSAHIFGCGL